jgi:hypothetical protein
MKRWLWSGLLVTSVVGRLGCADSDRHGTAPTLASIIIEPVSATISVQRPQQYKATGAYSDNTTADITSEVSGHLPIRSWQQLMTGERLPVRQKG